MIPRSAAKTIGSNPPSNTAPSSTSAKVFLPPRVSHSNVLTLHASALSMVVVSVQRRKYNWQHATHQHSAQLHQRQALPIAYDFWQNVYAGRIQKGACAEEYVSDRVSRQRRVTEQAP